MKETILKDDFAEIFSAGVRKGFMRALFMASDLIQNDPKLAIAVLKLSEKQHDVAASAIEEAFRMAEEMGEEKAGITFK